MKNSGYIFACDCLLFCSFQESPDSLFPDKLCNILELYRMQVKKTNAALMIQVYSLNYRF